MKRLFRYLKPLWEGDDNKISLRSVASILLIVHFVRDVDKASYVALKILNIFLQGKQIDASVVSAIAANLSQVAIILGLEAALIAALLGLKTYQNTVLGEANIANGYSPIASTPPSIPPPCPNVPTDHIT
jgi:hypothetical protein